MSGWKDWAIGEVVTESEFQSFVQDQVVQVYDDATDRDNTLGANVAEGMMCYLKDIDETQVYDGTDWVQVGEGTITEVVAGTALTGGGTSGSVTLNVDESEITLAQSQVTDLVTDLSNKASTTHATTHELGGTDEIEIAQSQVTGLDAGTEGFTALSNGTSGLSYQPVSHNYIINGAFDIWQRGTSFTSVNDFSANTADRWGCFRGSLVGGANISLQSSDLSGFRNVARVQRADGNTATQTMNFFQWLESDMSIPLAGKSVTISFYAKAGSNFSSSSNELRIDVLSGDGIDQNLISGFTNQRTVMDEALTLTTSWQKFTVTGTMASDATQLAVRFRTFPTGTAGANDYYEITGVQLEAGSIATPFKRNANSIAGELAACQRYFVLMDATNTSAVGVGTSFSSTSFRGYFSLPVQMRSTPDIEDPDSGIRLVVNGDSFGYTSFVAASGNLPQGVEIIAATSGMSATHPGIIRSAEVITFDAEL